MLTKKMSLRDFRDEQDMEAIFQEQLGHCGYCTRGCYLEMEKDAISKNKRFQRWQPVPDTSRCHWFWQNIYDGKRYPAII